MANEIGYRVDHQVATITLNRPESYNSLTPQCYKTLKRALGNAGADPLIRCVVLTGKGTAFSSGAHIDQKECETTFAPAMLGDVIKEKLNPIIETIRRIPQIVIAAVNGPCAGASAGIVLACDLIIASETAYFLYPFVKIGLSVDGGAGFFLSRLAGPKLALGYLLSGERIDASQAYACGIINKVVPAEELQKEVACLSERIVKGPYSQSLIKYVVNRASEMSLTDYLEMEAEYQKLASQSQDAKEGLNAFLNKRIPVFKGR